MPAEIQSAVSRSIRGMVIRKAMRPSQPSNWAVRHTHGCRVFSNSCLEPAESRDTHSEGKVTKPHTSALPTWLRSILGQRKLPHHLFQLSIKVFTNNSGQHVLKPLTHHEILTFRHIFVRGDCLEAHPSIRFRLHGRN